MKHSELSLSFEDLNPLKSHLCRRHRPHSHTKSHLCLRHRPHPQKPQLVVYCFWYASTNVAGNCSMTSTCRVHLPARKVERIQMNARGAQQLDSHLNKTVVRTGVLGIIVLDWSENGEWRRTHRQADGSYFLNDMLPFGLPEGGVHSH